MPQIPALRPRLIVLLVAALALVALAAPAASQAKPKHSLRVMTRNLYLGADLTPGLQAKSLNDLIDAAGAILNQVDQNKYSVRSKGLAAEILKRKPDLVGLQEGATWRTAPCKLIVPPAPPTATHVRYDFVKQLLTRLNKGKKRYKLLVRQPEFDLEVQANTNGSADHSCDTNVRLTMSDAILVRRKAGVKTSHVKKGHFKTVFAPKLLGAISFPVTRGWVQANVKVRGSKRFRFVNLHFEAFDSSASNPTNHGTSVGNGEIRQAQAKQLLAKGGAARGKRVVLIGDLNSDKRTEVKPGDGLAFKEFLAAGFKERSAARPFSCCIDSPLLRFPSGGGKKSDFDHRVDHVLTKGRGYRTLGKVVTGRKPAHGFWDSDHAGLYSRLRIP